MVLYRRLVPWLLSVVLALGTLTMAQARGQMAAGGFIEICAGQGTRLVPVDMAPGAQHPCPDCMAAHGVALLPDVVLPARPCRWSRQSVVAPARMMAPPAAHRPQARAPPVAG